MFTGDIMITNYDKNDNYGFINEARVYSALCGLISITLLVLILISKDSLLLTIDSVIDYNTGVIWAIVDTFGFINDLVQAISIILGGNIVSPSLFSGCYINIAWINTSFVLNSEHVNSPIT